MFTYSVNYVQKIQQGVIHVSGKLIERSGKPCLQLENWLCNTNGVVVEQSFWRGLWAPFAASDTDGIKYLFVGDCCYH